MSAHACVHSALDFRKKEEMTILGLIPSCTVGVLDVAEAIAEATPALRIGL